MSFLVILYKINAFIVMILCSILLEAFNLPNAIMPLTFFFCLTSKEKIS